MFAIAVAFDFNGYLVGMAIGGLGFGAYTGVDLALVADVLPDEGIAAKDLGVLNIAGALPSSITPAIAPATLAIGSGSYGVPYAGAGVCALLGAFAILPVKASDGHTLERPASSRRASGAGSLHDQSNAEPWSRATTRVGLVTHLIACHHGARDTSRVSAM